MVVSFVPRLLVFRLLSLAALCGLEFSVFGEEWTSFTVDTLDGFSFTHDHLSDGRFVFGKEGAVSVQDDFALTTFTTITNTDGRVFDPSFIAIRSATEGLIGGGGIFGPSGIFSFDPSSPTSPVAAALATLQNYGATYWEHPTSGRKGWLITGGNGSGGGNNLTFVSIDGSFTGPITGVLSAYSGDVAVNAATGDVCVVLADIDTAIDNQVLVFSADQIDGAVDAILQSSPAPLSKSDATNPFQADASGAVAVDALGRLWFGGYQIDHLQAWDPATGITRRFYPDHAPFQNAAGPTNYAPRAFSEGGTDYVSFLANDAYYTAGSELVLGYRPVSELEVRSIQFTTTSGTAREDEGSVAITVTITPVPDEPVTVPLMVSGSATPGSDFEAPTELSFDTGEAVKTVAVNLIDDQVRREGTETVILTLGRPQPTSQAGLGVLGTETFTLKLEDNEVPPVIAPTQDFSALQVGTEFHYQVTTAGGGDAVRWSARGLPPGLRIDPKSGAISGTPTAAGEFARLVITATNAYGRGVSKVFLLVVEPVPELATGRFFGVADRDSPETDGLGARIDLVINRRARWSGRVRLGRRNYPIRGALDTSSPNPTLRPTFRHQGEFVAMNLTIDADSGALSGGFVGGGSVTGWRGSANDSRSERCHFLLAVPGGPDPAVPEGTGFGIVRFGRRDTVRIVGRTGDGARFSSGGRLGPSGEAVIYQPLYRPSGTLLGRLTIADDLPQTVTGDFTWSKPAQNRGRLYRAGWPVPLLLQATGGTFRPVDGSSLPLAALPGTNPNASLLVQDGGIERLGPNPATFDVEIRSARRAVMERPNRLHINHRSGLFRGVVMLGSGDDRRRVVAQGLLIPDPATADPFDSVGHGFFLFPDEASELRSGLAILEPVEP
ncbi:MAG: putative Ig domain-containing protein [Verrucomicrobiae bacterium]|nr:putative Ig domain-containing protein [Verrucomicrobiae bacterium]